MMHYYPACYLDFLKSMGRIDDVNALYDGNLTIWNNSWFLHAILLPEIEKMPKKVDQTKDITIDYREF